ncbi:hypothetical protein QQS21_003621 [Conoideocrella luteorostrata]|uniref:FHA domain-containing protein n=1 Tax=Conoideocrella luteorostrata TaxID=1105319 RepID=A0AAJ0CVU3_9HYPO|nr:hypothetical protein QQS21_003621 [Conoideocrella luteorostrata]
MSGIQMSDGHGQETSSQLPVARLEYICSRDGRKTKGIIAIYDNDIFKIGRDPRSNDFSIQSDRESLVSRNHCEFYTVVYEPGLNYVYVRDRKSFNGTLVNDKMIGKGPGFSSGYLLEDGDVIKILPYWKFIFHQESSPPLGEMSIVQLAESQVRALTTPMFSLTNLSSCLRISIRYQNAALEKE